MWYCVRKDNCKLASVCENKPNIEDLNNHGYDVFEDKFYTDDCRRIKVSKNKNGEYEIELLEKETKKTKDKKNNKNNLLERIKKLEKKIEEITD